jgi:hypothetical protein
LRGEGRGEDLEGIDPVEPGVPSTINLSHPALTEKRKNLVGAQPLSN